ncbi:hypothetical protein RUM44_009369 [Polyplax serrata]|uniref:Uncharacterized protein n=1 Tax=Polyplax serrata TaxID=468196 RepID=A0ABR1ASH6_POLSC
MDASRRVDISDRIDVILMIISVVSLKKKTDPRRELLEVEKVPGQDETTHTCQEIGILDGDIPIVRREREHSPPATKQRSAKPNLRRENKGGEEEAERIGVLAKMEKVDFSSLEHWVSDSRRRHRGGAGIPSVESRGEGFGRHQTWMRAQTAREVWSDVKEVQPVSDGHVLGSLALI